MDFDQLNTFLEVAKLGNFSRAAEKVLRSQPAVSAQIRQLEQDFLNEGGLRERMTRARLEERQKQGPKGQQRRQ